MPLDGAMQSGSAWTRKKHVRTNRMTAQRRFHLLLLAIGLLGVLLLSLFAGSAIGSAAHESKARVANSVRMVERSFRLTQPDQKQRLTVGCPGRSAPLGGGMTSSPAPTAGGEGVYPHSYERLGVQHGWHVTAVLFDPDRRSTQPRDVTLQVTCGPRLGHVTPPHTTRYVKPGQTKSAVAVCPGHRRLFAGGFQRTDFVSSGGAYVLESRAISGRAWRVTAHAFGGFGGQVTAIAYCTRSKRPLLTPVEATTDLGPGLGTATTPACPPGTRLTAGGFSTNGSTSVFFTDGMINDTGTWSASGYNWGSGASITAYGYCLNA
jgi:hypothetical protein